MYDIGPHSTLVPFQDVHVQNVDLGGFIPIVEETYDKLRGIDPVSEKDYHSPTHVACNHLNLQLAEVARQNGQNVLDVRTDLREVLPDYQCMPKSITDYMPKSITDYISHVGNVLTQTGVDLRLNLPPIAR